MRMSPSFSHVGLLVTGLLGLPSAGAWRNRARGYVPGTPSVIDFQAKPYYVSAPERCP